MIRITLKLLTLAFQPAYQTIRRSRYFVALHPTWLLKLFLKQNTVDHQLIYGHLEFSYSPFYQANSHIEELQMKSSITKYAKLITIFPLLFKVPWVQKLRTFWLSSSRSRLMKDLQLEISYSILGCRTLTMQRIAENWRKEASTNFIHKNTYPHRRGPSLNVLMVLPAPSLQRSKTIKPNWI